MKTAEQDLYEDIEIGKWKVSSKYGILTSPEDKTLVLEPRLSKLMYLLSLNVNEIVTRDYLIRNIWRDTVVNEESLTRAVADLRKTLLMNFNQAVTIETIAKRGYKLSLAIGPKIYALKLKLKPRAAYFIAILILLTVTLVLVTA